MYRYILIFLVFVGLYHFNLKESRPYPYEEAPADQVKVYEPCQCWEYYLKTDPVNDREMYETCDSLEWLRVSDQVEVFNIIVPCEQV